METPMQALIDAILRAYDFNLAYAKALMADLPMAHWCMAAGPGLENHPAFSIGHLVMGTAHINTLFEAGFDVPDGWRALFDRTGPGDPTLPKEGAVHYPDHDALLAELQRQHDKLRSHLTQASTEALTRPVQWRFTDYFPRAIDLVLFMAVSHEINHLSQMAAWRRAHGLPSALATL